jgi:beta-lactam-binding protein with PASTA domain
MKKLSTPKSAATELENLTGKTRVEAKEYLEKAGFEYKGSTAGGYDKFYHPDGEVVRTGPKIKSAEGKSYNPRVDQHGQFTQTHNTGEVLKK